MRLGLRIVMDCLDNLALSHVHLHPRKPVVRSRAEQEFRRASDLVPVYDLVVVVGTHQTAVAHFPSGLV